MTVENLEETNSVAGGGYQVPALGYGSGSNISNVATNGNGSYGTSGSYGNGNTNTNTNTNVGYGSSGTNGGYGSSGTTGGWTPVTSPSPSLSQKATPVTSPSSSPRNTVSARPSAAQPSAVASTGDGWDETWDDDDWKSVS